MERIFIENKLYRHIKTFAKGKIFFSEDFMDLGNIESINRALSRLKDKGIINRLAQGIYFKPKKDDMVGIIYPTIEEIAKGIAKRDKARIIPTGVYALNKLGISDQVPMNTIFLTDGAARTVKINKRTIKFKKTTPKNLMIKGEISSLIIQALKEIGKNNVNTSYIEKIKKQLLKEKKEIVIHDAKLAPTWIRKILMEIINEQL